METARYLRTPFHIVCHARALRRISVLYHQRQSRHAGGCVIDECRYQLAYQFGSSMLMFRNWSISRTMVSFWAGISSGAFSPRLKYRRARTLPVSDKNLRMNRENPKAAYQFVSDPSGR